MRVEVYTIYQALRFFQARDESNASYTAFSDSTAAISRAQTDRAGLGQAFARAIIEADERLKACECSVALLWTHRPTGE